jgi:hypothetical protein
MEPVLAVKKADAVAALLADVSGILQVVYSDDFWAALSVALKASLSAAVMVGLKAVEVAAKSVN